MYNKYFEILINEAEKNTLDIPVCAMIVKNNEILSIANNKREENNSVIAHAEILAIWEANKKLNSRRLDGCDIYVTLEPCPMCAWAIINSGVKNLYFGSYNTQYGAFGSAINLAKLANSKINVYGGIYEERCKELLDSYFKGLRNEK